MTCDLFTLAPGRTPLLVTFPHAGTHVPPAIASRMTEAALLRADSDWHLPQLYGFMKDMGAGMLMAHASRYVVDLNRPPKDSNLYPGQDTTGLVPVDTFRKEPIYRPGETPGAQKSTNAGRCTGSPGTGHSPRSWRGCALRTASPCCGMRIPSPASCRASSRAGWRTSISAPPTAAPAHPPCRPQPRRC